MPPKKKPTKAVAKAELEEVHDAECEDALHGAGHDAAVGSKTRTAQGSMSEPPAYVLDGCVYILC